MTDEDCADVVYFEPLTAETVTAIIKKERPDGMLATLGGQTGLNLALKLDQQGVLKKYNVQLLGTPIASIKKGEDRELFRDLMYELNEPVPDSEIVHTVDEAKKFANEIGFPIIIRPAYTLGGAGGGIANDEIDLIRIVSGGLAQSPITQCLVEKSIAGFKEIEYEVMRDENDTCITICNMENIDPVGIHTGDSIVVAPSQTLSDRNYQMLRSASIKIIRALGIVGGCNIQFALDTKSDQYYLIEVNPRVSRSSALASKATGYPIARIAAKLSIGYHLNELMNPVTGHTYASFEPALDYCIVKFPRWPFDKFFGADRRLGTQMKATGEVMAIERSFEAALQKALRSLEIGIVGLRLERFSSLSTEDLWNRALQKDDNRLFILFELLSRGVNVEAIHEQTMIDFYFLNKFKQLIELEKEAEQISFLELTQEKMMQLKRSGFSDLALSRMWNVLETDVFNKRQVWNISPSYKMVDTCAAEFQAQTPYYYSSYFGENEAIPTDKAKILIIGSGPIRIGQGIEFDYCSVHGAKTVRKLGFEAIIMNNNPETVSTDYMTADRLYFEPLTAEDILAVANLEKVAGVIVTLSGQTGINVTEQLEKAGLPVLGITSAAIHQLEERQAFYQFLNELAIPHIPGEMAQSKAEAVLLAKSVKYPVLVRPSYVIGGQGMAIVSNEAELVAYMETHEFEGLFPLLMDQYVPGIELDMDVLTDGQHSFVAGMFEHVEKAGVHSGDSMAITPPHRLKNEMLMKLEEAAKSIASKMDFKGVFNIQFVVKDDLFYVIEVNPRASRTVPLLAKVAGQPLIEMATKLILGATLSSLKLEPIRSTFYAAKAPVFSYGKLAGLDPMLGAEMKSTGELLMFGKTPEAALAKISAPFETLPKLYEEGEKRTIFVDSVAGKIERPIIQELRQIGFEIVTQNFEQWVESDEARALIVLNEPGKTTGLPKRMKALEKQLTVLTEEETIQAMLTYFTANHTVVQSIEEWHSIDSLSALEEIECNVYN
ncbi:carbamoyl-phosphate synthase large chain [Bacillus sp. JCM 19046]|nr:carbamoyl-phosphate synthase large chain [Bacillus sp. JCM 19046]